MSWGQDLWDRGKDFVSDNWAYSNPITGSFALAGGGGDLSGFGDSFNLSGTDPSVTNVQTPWEKEMWEGTQGFRQNVMSGGSPYGMPSSPMNRFAMGPNAPTFQGYGVGSYQAPDMDLMVDKMGAAYELPYQQMMERLGAMGVSGSAGAGLSGAGGAAVGKFHAQQAADMWQNLMPFVSQEYGAQTQAARDVWGADVAANRYGADMGNQQLMLDYGRGIQGADWQNMWRGQQYQDQLARNKYGAGLQHEYSMAGSGQPVMMPGQQGLLQSLLPGVTSAATLGLFL